MSRPSMNLFSDWPVVKWRSTHRGGITSKANGAEPLSLPVEGRDCGPFFLPEPAFLHRYFSVTARARDNPGVAIYLLFIVGLFYFFAKPNMLGLCLYVPGSNSDTVEVEYFESNGLPSELKSLFNKLSVFLPSQELSTYQKWRKVC